MTAYARPDAGNDLSEALGRLPAVGILRGCPADVVTAMASAAAEVGLGVLEVTLDSPDPLRAIERLIASLPEVVVGAGTVRTADEVRHAIDAGARFIVSPITSAHVISASVELNIPALPGAATPTEIWGAADLGATAVKVFPARQLGGPEYIRAILGPLGEPRLIPTGGVGPDNAAAFLDAGAWAVGVGGSVFPPEALRSGDTARVGSLASALVRSIL